MVVGKAPRSGRKLSIMMEDDFALVDRDALVDELISRSSRTVGENATLSSGEDHVAWLDAERKKGWTYWQRYSEYMEARIPWTALDALDVAIYPRLCLLPIFIVHYIGLTARVCAAV